MTEKLNCWEYFQCGREVSNQHRSDSVCNVSLISSFNGTNGGSNAGRYCWHVEGSYCISSQANVNKEHDRGTVLFKENFCRSCSFRQLVKREEGSSYKN